MRTGFAKTPINMPADIERKKRFTRGQVQAKAKAAAIKAGLIGTGLGAMLHMLIQELRFRFF